MQVRLVMVAGVRDNRELLNINDMSINYGIILCIGLLFYHAFTGSDYSPSFTGSDYSPSFYNIGKNRWWDLMVEENADPSSNLPKVFTELNTSPEYVTEFHLNVIEQFTLKAYRSTAKSLHEACFNVVKNELVPETFRKLPPSKPALSIIAGHLW